MNNTPKLTAVDLFCGGGGLTVGLKKAHFNVIAAVENEPNAIATYKSNHPKTYLFENDIRNISGKELLNYSPNGRLDFLTGCPPCQGFTSLTQKYKREDPRNELVLEFARLIRETTPSAIMMENVPGLEKRGHRLLKPLLDTLSDLGYVPQLEVLQVADYGVPQFRRRLVLIAGKGFKIPFPNPTYSKDGIGRHKWRTVRQCIFDFPEPNTFTQAKEAGIENTDWHVVRNISALNLERLRHAIPGKHWNNIPDELQPECHKGNYNGFANVYGRMEWDQVSPTITGGCTSISKGRFGHPEALRTISVREAACLQTFPKNYRFPSPYIDQVCKIIGNALPCLFAEKLAAQCYKYLIEHQINQ